MMKTKIGCPSGIRMPSRRKVLEEPKDCTFGSSSNISTLVNVLKLK